MILVTGATGFLGSKLVEKLVSSAEQVRVLYRDESNLSVLAPYLEQIECVEGDILDIKSLERAMEGVDTVCHCAAYISFNSSDYNQLMKVNMEGTANVVNVMLAAGSKRLLHVSSIAAIGAPPVRMINEDSKWDKHPYNTAYGLSKMLAEREVKRGQEEGLETIIVNPGIIVGSGFWEEKTMSAVFSSVEKGMPFYMPGRNAYVDVDDTAEIMLQLLNKEEALGERYILIAENRDFKWLLSTIATLMNAKAPSFKLNKLSAYGIAFADWLLSTLSGKPRRLYIDNLKVSMQEYSYSNEKIRHLLNYSFKPLEESLKEIATAYKSYQAQINQVS